MPAEHKLRIEGPQALRLGTFYSQEETDPRGGSVELLLLPQSGL